MVLGGVVEACVLFVLTILKLFQCLNKRLQLLHAHVRVRLTSQLCLLLVGRFLLSEDIDIISLRPKTYGHDDVLIHTISHPIIHEDPRIDIHQWVF